MKLAIVVSEYKLQVFERNLTKNGYTYTKPTLYHADSFIFLVETKNLQALREILDAAEAEATNTPTGALQ